MRKHLVAGGLMVLAAAGCSSGHRADEQPAGSRVLPTPEGVVVGVAWPAADQLVLTVADQSTLPAVWSTYVLNAPSGQAEALELPEPDACSGVRHGFPRPLADGRVSLTQLCELSDPGSPAGRSAVLAVDPVSGEVEVLSELGPDVSPSGTSWDPALRRGVAAQSSAICARLFGIDRSGPTPLPVRLGEGEDSWIADAELPSGCTEGRADWPAWSPDGARIAFFSSPESVSKEDFGRLDEPWQVLLMDPDTLQTRVLVEGVEHARAMTWSPDGRWLAYAAEEDGVFVVSADGGRPRRISEERTRWLAWSPDGGELAAAGAAPGSSDTERADRLLVLDLSGLEP